MTVAPLIAMKSTKCESLEAVGKELDRRAHTYANDVDQSGRHIGYCCRADDAHPLPLDKAVERRMGELNTKRKIRDNAVRAMGFIVSSNDALDEKSAREFLDRSINWFGARYGYENLLAAQIHLDEGTPHAHFGFTPIKDGTLSWKNYFDGRDALRGWQDRFFEKVSKPWGLERGEKDTGRTHKDAAQMRRDAEREIKELDKRKECLRQEVEEMEAATPSLSEGVRTLWKARSDGSREEGLGSDLEGLRGRISDLSSQIADCNGRAEGIERGLPALRARYRELAERFNDTRSRVEQALGRLREVPNTLSELAQDIARKLGKPLFDPNSLDYRKREVTRLAEALDRDRPHVPQQRGHGAR